MKHKHWIGIAAIVFAMASTVVVGQRGQGGQRGQAPQTPKASAPVDLTGYWVSLVTEDWR
jgi:hypothetical protein